jgi:hypothetical protein
MKTLNPSPPAHDQPLQASASDPPAIDSTSVNLVMEEVLASSPFCHTQQCQNLLRYIVKHSLTQEDNLLRERVIGAEVFGRKPDYDTGEDPVVRIRVAEVRKRLAQFYQSTAEAVRQPDIHIEIPSGSYRANFRWRDSGHLAHEPSAPHSPNSSHALIPIATEPISHPSTLIPYPDARAAAPASSRLVRWLFVATALLVCVFLGYKLSGALQQREFRTFWQPWTSSSKPVIISIGSNAVYRVSELLTERYAREHNLEPYGEEFYIPTGPKSEITGSDIEPAFNSFVALGDVAAVTDVAAALTGQQHAFRLRFPDDISFAELRDTPTVLVGGFNNPMTIELTKNLPFVLLQRNEIQDTLAPSRHWTLHSSEDSHDTEDYAIITRLAQRNGDAPILSVAGMGQYGTLAASQFICNPASITAFTHKLPRGWASHNLQLVLHVHVVDFKPSSTDIVAVHTW